MPRTAAPTPPDSAPDEGLASAECSTIEVARRLGMAVRSVQLMVDRGELEAWRTPGGHRRISRASVERWLAGRQGVPPARRRTDRQPAPGSRAPQLLLIEDSRHYQNLVSLLVEAHFPQAVLHLADDGIAGLAMAGQLQPDLLLVDILLPGIDGATLITGLRSHASFQRSRLIVVTSLEDAELAPYRFAMADVPVVHKTRLVTDLPPLIRQTLQLAPARA
jgi:excisionase family DNA binding protein